MTSRPLSLLGGPTPDRRPTMTLLDQTSRSLSRPARLAAALALSLLASPALASTLAVSDPGAQPAAANVAAGAAGIFVGKVRLTATGGTVVVTQLQLANAGTALANTDVESVQLFQDANGNGTFDPAIDTYLGAAAWNATASRYQLTTNLSVPAATPATVLVVLATTSSATATRTFRAQFATGDVTVKAPDTVGAFTAISNNTFTLIAGTSAGSTNAAAPTVLIVNPMNGGTVSGTFRVQVQVYNPGGLAALTAVTLSTDGGTTYPTTLTQTAAYSVGTNAGVYEAQLTLSPGSYSLRARAANNVPLTATSTISVIAANAARQGDGNLLVRDNASQLCSDCHALATHSSQAVGGKYGAWAVGCRDCHAAHSTTNAYLVRQTIQPPNYGTALPAATVKFLTTTGDSGAANNSFANSDNTGICQVCHTRTANGGAVARWRSSGNSDTHFTASSAQGTQPCTNCHSHANGFSGRESDGGYVCSTCHGGIWNEMQAVGGSAYKHTLGLDTFTDDATSWTSPLNAVAPAARSCVNMCHDDHTHTATDDPSPLLHYNLAYDDSSTNASRAATTRTVATKAKTDFDNTLANGGMCLSCHRNPVDSTVPVQHPAIDKAAYAASPHSATTTTPGGAWQYTLHDSSVFVRNCTKCHWEAADGTTPAVANAMGLGAVHGNANPSLLMGTTNPNGVTASFICYRCHGNGTVGVNYSNKTVSQDGAKAVAHPFDKDAVHATPAETAATWGTSLGVAGRHSNCLDCHDPHEAKTSMKSGTATVAGTTTTLTDSTKSGIWSTTYPAGSLVLITSGTLNNQVRKIASSTAAGVITILTTPAPNAAWASAPAAGTSYVILDNHADGALQGAMGAKLTTYPAANFGTTAATNFTTGPLVAGTDLEASLCFRCHSTFYWGAGTPPNGISANGTQVTPVETDNAQEFNPNNASGHPVLVGLNSYGAASVAPKPLLTTQMKAPWNLDVGNQTMSCSDCHTTDAASPAAQGPHGSAAQFMLKGANAANWPNVLTSSFATSWCANCHNDANLHTRDGAHTGAQCYRCHIVIPHGGKLGRLIGDARATSTMPARYAYNGDKTTMYASGFTKTTATGYQKSNCAASCSTGDHPLTNGAKW